MELIFEGHFPEIRSFFEKYFNKSKKKLVLFCVRLLGQHFMGYLPTQCWFNTFYLASNDYNEVCSRISYFKKNNIREIVIKTKL